MTPPTCPPSAAAVSLGPVRTSHRRTRPSPGALDAVSTNAGFKEFEELFEGLVPTCSGPPRPGPVAARTTVTAPACDPGDADTQAPVRTSQAATPVWEIGMGDWSVIGCNWVVIGHL